MSKKYFINNIDTAFGQALIGQLVKQPTEDPVHMCTVRVPADKKPQGIKKILKRDKPKLFRKKMIEECEVYVYSLDQTEITDIEFGIQTMGKPFEDNKVFVFVSDIMAWSNTSKKIKKEAPPPVPEEGENAQKPPQPKQEEQAEAEQGQQSKSNEQGSDKQAEEEEVEQKPIEYTFFQDIDYQTRIPLQKYQYIKQIEDKVLSIKRQNIKVFVVCPGIVYGCGEDTFYELFKSSWLQQPEKLPYLNQGNNKIPTIHLKDLVKFVIKIAESPPEGSPYLLALDQTQNKTQKSIVQAISRGVGSNKIDSVKQSTLIENVDRYLIDLDMKSSKILIGTVEEPVQFEWTSRKGISESIGLLLKDFCSKELLRPIKLVILQNQKDWKDSKINFILKSFSEYYRIPVLNIKLILQNAKDFGDDELSADLKEQWANISNYLNGEVANKELDQTMKVFYRAIRWRLTQNDCQNRGFILENYPRFTAQLNFIFNKLSLKKLKRKKPKPVPVPKVSQKSINSDEEIAPPVEEQPKEQQQKQQQQPVEEEGGEEQAGPKTQPYYPESIISIKRMGTASVEQVIDFFTSQGMQELVYDTTGMKQHQIFESIRNYIERNGRPNNYLIAEEQLFKKHIQFTSQENKQSLSKREHQVKRKIETDAEIQGKRKKLAEQICELVRNEGQQQIKKMPFRNYLMQFVVPTLNIGLLEVSNIIPNDPVDLLAEFLFQKSYDA